MGSYWSTPATTATPATGDVTSTTATSDSSVVSTVVADSPVKPNPAFLANLNSQLTTRLAEVTRRSVGNVEEENYRRLIVELLKTAKIYAPVTTTLTATTPSSLSASEETQIPTLKMHRLCGRQLRFNLYHQFPLLPEVNMSSAVATAFQGLQSDMNAFKSAIAHIQHGGMIHEMTTQMMQFVVDPHEQSLSCVVTKSGLNVLASVPKVVAVYAIWTYLVAQQCSLVPGELVINVGMLYLYDHETQQASTFLETAVTKFPEMTVISASSIDAYTETSIQMSY